MPCKKNYPNGAPGYWGGDIHQRIIADNTANKIEALLIDKLESLGKQVFLWQQVYADTPNVLECSCFKDTAKRPDITCNSCYGTNFMPGYIKFLHDTTSFPSIAAGITLTNIRLDTTIKPHRLLLDDAALTGTIDFAPVLFSNLGYAWEYKLDAPIIKSTNTITVTFSTNGTTYYPITSINTLGIKPVGIGNLYIKVVLTKAIVDDRGPEFEIFRLRHPKVDEPYIKILRPQITEVPTWLQYGARSEQVGEAFWTVPLNYFDATIPAETPAARILENSFYARINGIDIGNRYVTTKLSYNDQFGQMTQQSFVPRRVQPEEVYSRLVF